MNNLQILIETVDAIIPASILPVLLLLRLGLLVRHKPDEDGVLGHLLWLGVVLVHVAGGDGQHGPVRGKGQAGDGGWILVELTQPLLVVPVPDVDEAVTPTSGEGVVLLVEGDGVDWIDILNTILLHSVALECIFQLAWPSLACNPNAAKSHPSQDPSFPI